jgi:hypothetical protein
VPRLRLLLAAALLTLVAAGCGTAESQLETAETEGLYRTVNGLKYQVQLSRVLNPNDVEDREYFLGLPPGTTPPTGEETWFGVWMRVQNETDEPLPAADEFEIVDTQEDVYRPVAVDPEQNPFVYAGGTVPPNTVVPLADSAAGQGPVQGQLLLFKLTNQSLQNRPLELRFSNGPGTDVGSYDLDV